MTIGYVYEYQNLSECLLQNLKCEKSERNDVKEEMKDCKAVYVARHKIQDNQLLVYHNYANIEYTDGYAASNFGCQYDSKKDNVLCTCRRISSRKPQEMRYFSGITKQIYAYHGSRSFTDIGVGVGSIKALQRRKIKRVYLPEIDNRGVGSSDLSSYVIRKSKEQKNSYYNNKKTSSKCVGGIIEYNTGCAISEKLSPIVQTKSGSTSPKVSYDQRNIEIGSNTVYKNFVTIGTQFEMENQKSEECKEETVKSDREMEMPKKMVDKVSEQTQKNKYSTEIQAKRRAALEKRVKEVDKVFSSDSLVQHVHNLENPSDDKQSRGSNQCIDPMENKLEREYRRMFSTKERDSKSSVDKPIPEFKSASILRRRFEALRRGLAKKEDGKKNVTPSSQDSVPSRKDASVTSDPPSLEGRSFTDAKIYNPIQANVEQEKTQVDYKTERDSLQWPPYNGHTSDIDSECQGVKGMFKLWSKKFNFEEEAEKARSKPIPSLAIDINKQPHKESKINKVNDSKKQGRKFFFFKKKSKEQKEVEKPIEKEREPYVPSGGVTAGRCEIRDGLTLKMGTATPKAPVAKIIEEKDEEQRMTWLKKFLANTIESARSVNVRWNNSMYATSSSTVFELMDTIYKNNGVVIKSRSEITTDESSYFRSYNKNKVYFDRNIEAWMVPKTIPDRPKEIPIRIHANKEMKDRDIECTLSGHRWFIEKSKGFANKIEVVLHSNLNKISKLSSEYLRIDIPKDFFDVSSSDDSKQHPTSDEVVYKVVEYESDLNTKKALQKGDHAKVIVSVQEKKNFETKILETVIKRPPMHRDVVIQGSNVNIPKRCDVIEVGIITQRDMRVNRKPILKIQDDLTDDDSEENLNTNPKKCEFAESYLQEYYRHWTPLGIDFFSWCVSDSHLRSCSEKSLISFHNQGDGSKSCPNICEEFQTSAIISSCNTSSCSQCYEPKEDIRKAEDSKSCKFFKKFKKSGKDPSKAKTDTDIPGTRILPKDSLEVFKRRKIYAASLKSQWACSEDKPVSVPSIESKGAQNTFIECPKLDKSICRPPRHAKKKTCKKHVSMPDCETMNNELDDQLCEDLPAGILAYKGQAGCDACKKKGMKCPKHPIVKPKICVIPQPPCKESCEKTKKPSCIKPGSPTCNVHPDKSALQDVLSKIPKLLGLDTEPSICRSPTRKPTPCKPSSKCCTPTKTPSPCPSTIPLCQRRRNAEPNIKPMKCSPPISPCGSNNASPKSSHNCMSPQSPSPQKKCPKMPCLKYPGCRPSSSSESSPVCSPPASPKASPKCSPRGSPKSPPGSSGLNLKNCGTGPKKPKPKKPKLCKVPPCSEIKKRKSPPKSPCESNDFPWPKNSQLSNPPSPSCSEDSPPKDKNKCKKNCSMMNQSSSVCSLAVHSMEKECKPQCPNRKPKPECPEKPSCPVMIPDCLLRKPKCSSSFCHPSRPVSPRCPSKSTSPPKKTSCSPKPICTPVNPLQPPLCPAQQPVCPPRPECPVMKPTECPAMKPPECPVMKPPEYPAMKPPECPASKQQLCPIKKPSCIETGKAKISGLFLKMKPSKKKSCNKECSAWDSESETGVVRLNSREKITISMKRETPSTEEIREGMNIKVQDDDGNTLYERKDYACNNTGHRPSVLGDMYKDSKIHRVSTLVTNNDEGNEKPEVTDYRSEQSLTNLIEIQFKLRITNGDKTTEINIGNEEDNKQDRINEISRTSPEVYVVDKETKEPVEAIEDSDTKNDINIKIVVKNYKATSNKHRQNTIKNDEFTKKISDKFHTVSTGYSENMCLNGDNLFSIGRTAVEFRSSEEKSKAHSNELVSEELTEPINFVVSSHSDHLASGVTEDDNVDKSISSKKDTQSYDIYDYTNTNELETKDLDTDQDALELNTSDECNDIKYSSREDKKELLKKVFEKAHTKPKNKENVRHLRDILKIILTDSSDNEDTNAASELAKDVTYASLKPDFFRNTDSMNNYYKMESPITIDDSKTSNAIYPTKENNSVTSCTSNKIKRQGCMCSHVAEKLNNDNRMMKFGCCCRQQSKVDGMTSCDLRNEQDMLSILNYRAEYADVHTQNSKHSSKKSNSSNVSNHKQEKNKVLKEKNNNITQEDAVDKKEPKVKNNLELTNILSSPKSHNKECKMMKLNRNTVLGISDDDKIILLSEEAAKKTAKKKQDRDIIYRNNLHLFKGADVLQCYETKKAVLEIYAERTVTQQGEQYVAKLPKFVFEEASEITRNYDEIAANSYKSVFRRNVFKMSVKR